MEEYTVDTATGYLLGMDVTPFPPLSDLNSSNASYSSNASTLSSVSLDKQKESSVFNCGEGMLLFRFIFQVVLNIPICVIGISGNSLAFAVLCYQKQKASTTLLLQALSIADTIILIMAICLRSLRYIYTCFGSATMEINYSLMFVILYPCAFTFRMINTWLTTILTIDRWIAVCRPLHAQRLVTKKMALVHMVVVIVGAVLISLPRFFEYRIKIYSKRGSYSAMPTALTHNTYYTIFYKIIFFLISMYIIPMITLFVLNVKLVKALKTAERDRKVLQHSSDTVQQNRNVTAIVVVVVSTFLICNSLPFCSQILHSIELAFPDSGETITDVRRKLTNVSDLLLTINSAVNFLIYCACSRKFRKTFVHMFRCEKKADPKYLIKGTTSSTSAVTYLSLTRSRSSSASAHKSVDRAQTYA